MELVNHFNVPAPPEEVFAALLDVERIAPCMPGATLLGGDGKQYDGRLKLRVGPITAAYEGTVVIDEVDEAGKAAHLRAEGLEVNGQGSASASVATAVEPDGDGSRVSITTKLDVHGRAAQFGRGVLSDVAQRVIDQFARNLEAELLAPAPETAPSQETPAAPAAATPAAATSTSAGDDATGRRESPAQAVGELDVVAAVALPVLRRVAPALAALAVGLVIGRLLGSRRRAAAPAAGTPWAAPYGWALPAGFGPVPPPGYSPAPPPGYPPRPHPQRPGHRASHEQPGRGRTDEHHETAHCDLGRRHDAGLGGRRV